MYKYSFDEETGGVLLLPEHSHFSKEPRPVYYREMDLLGFDKYFDYEKNDDAPILWAESTVYYYRGKNIAKTIGGSCYTKPELFVTDEGKNVKTLFSVDVAKMVKKNEEMLEAISQETMRRLYNTYLKYKDKVDVFYVAFSGGKDSIVTLDIVQKTLPHTAFKVLFADTGMEFPDTDETVKKVKTYCESENIEFFTARSHFTPDESWHLFGPPASVNRWCCSVHKTAPQILLLREKMGKPNFTGFAFTGVRADESLSRSKYDYVSRGEKHSGQWSCNPIFEFNSAELYLYIFKNNLIMNETYKKGNKRAGCLVCPGASERSEFFASVFYKNNFDKFIEIIKELYGEKFKSENQLENFIENGGWKARKNGRDISLETNYFQRQTSDKIIITVQNPKTDWKIWIKTIGVLLNEKSPYTILFEGFEYSFSLKFLNETDYEVKISTEIFKTNPKFVKLLKNVFRRAASCVMCRECETNCHNGYITMKGGNFQIDKKCNHCARCHEIEKGCLLYKSLGLEIGDSNMQNSSSLNRYSHHAPKMDWLKQYFSYKNEFDEKHNLGTNMYSFFKRFLRDTELLNDAGFSLTAKVIEKIGLTETASWAIMLVNLSYTPQINWFVKNIPMNETLSRDYVLQLLVSSGAKESWAGDVWSAWGRFLDLPFNKVGMGNANIENGRFTALTRTPYENAEPRVVLYSLYKFAEHCGDYKHFTLSRLYNDSIESEGISPKKIFGIPKDEIKKILTGLSFNYPAFINAAFNMDLDSIDLREEKTSTDVLELF